jgi:hypothetical protein
MILLTLSFKIVFEFTVDMFFLFYDFSLLKIKYSSFQYRYLPKQPCQTFFCLRYTDMILLDCEMKSAFFPLAPVRVQS